MLGRPVTRSLKTLLIQDRPVAVLASPCWLPLARAESLNAPLAYVPGVRPAITEIIFADARPVRRLVGIIDALAALAVWLGHALRIDDLPKERKVLSVTGWPLPG